MGDRPILFSAPMVRALLAGTKTQTRRFLDAWTDEPPAIVRAGEIIAFDENEKSYRWPRTSAVGDRLYVREAWHAARSLDSTPPRSIPRDADIEHAATARSYAEIGLKGKLRPGIHMPRWASRLTLTVTDVRVERLQDISEDDARAEGIESILRPDGTGIGVHVVVNEKVIGGWVQPRNRDVFETLWEHLNGPGSWEANPWGAAYTFSVALGNIDTIARSTA